MNDPAAKPVIDKVFATQAAENERAFASLGEIADEFQKAVQTLAQSVEAGGKILFCGNGGSASSASHMVNDCVGHMYVDRDPIPAISLADNASVLTALSNDYGYESIFERQVRVMGNSGDVLVAISTSGTSENVVRAVKEAKNRGLSVIGLTARGGATVRDLSDHWLPAATDDPVCAEQVHLFLLHTLTEALEAVRFPEDPGWGNTKGVRVR